MIKFKQVNSGVFVAETSIVQISDDDLTFLKQAAQSVPNKRARICAHNDSSDTLHEMIIAIAQSSYVRPHRHNGKSESFHIIEGLADVIIFDEGGKIIKTIALGPVGSGREFFYRLSDNLFHTILVRSDMLVMHETTNGPFIADQTEYASFAPKEADVESADKYLKNLDLQN